MQKITEPTDIVDGGFELISVFIKNRKRYQEILRSKEYIVDYDLQLFMKNHRSNNIYSKNYVRIRNEYINEFKKYKIQSGCKSDDYKLLVELVNNTRANKIHWRRVKNDNSGLFLHQIFLATYKNKSVIATIIGRRNTVKDKWNATLRVEVNSVANKVPVNHRIYNDLYKVIFENIKKQDIEKLKQKEALDRMIVTPQHIVVRTNIFRCYAHKHVLKEVLAIFQVMKPDGSLVEEKATAAYCFNCNCFFLMISEYEHISKNGRIQCQLVEKEVFYKHGPHGLDMAGESVLMRNGYNVKASVGLTDIQRQAILANIIDNKILTASQVLSYLRLFRAQKIGMSDYKAAVNKWETDMEFVRLYKENNKERVYINSITRTRYKKIKE